MNIQEPNTIAFMLWIVVGARSGLFCCIISSCSFVHSLGSGRMVSLVNLGSTFPGPASASGRVACVCCLKGWTLLEFASSESEEDSTEVFFSQYTVVVHRIYNSYQILKT